MPAVPARLPKVHQAVRAFIHTSSRSCHAAEPAFHWAPVSNGRETKTPRPFTPILPSANSSRLYNDDDAPPPTDGAVEASSESYELIQEDDPYKVSVRGEYIERRLHDKRGKLVKYVLSKPGFSLKAHPLASHPCVSGLGLDHGTLVPYQPIPAWEQIRRKRDAQRALAQSEGHCNLPPHTLGTWIVFWDEHPPTRSRRLPDYIAYEQPITYECTCTKRAPEFSRGQNSVLLTCFLRANHVADDILKFDELGMPLHVTELLLALPLKAFDSGTQDLPTVTRISPAQYVLTCRSPIARRALLSGWHEYETEVEKLTGRMPPYTIEADEQPATHDDKPAAQPTQRRSPYSYLRGAPPTAEKQGLDARIDASGRLWLGGARYARLEDLPSLLLQGANANARVVPPEPSEQSTPSPTAYDGPQQKKTQQPTATKNPTAEVPRRARRVEENPRMWAMPPELAKLLG